MFAKRRTAGLFGACLIAMACGGARAEEPAPASDTAAYYVIGVGPGDPTLVISPGEIKKGLFTLGGDPAALTATGGFIVGKIDKAGPLAITGVSFVNPPAQDWGIAGWLQNIYKDKRSYLPCGDQTTVFFEPVAGKVTYIGTITYMVMPYQAATSGVKFSVGNDMDSVHAFLAAKYPELAGRVEQGSYQFRSVDRVCDRSLF